MTRHEYSLLFVLFDSSSFLCPFIYLNLVFSSPIYWINLVAQIAKFNSKISLTKGFA